MHVTTPVSMNPGWPIPRLDDLRDAPKAVWVRWNGRHDADPLGLIHRLAKTPTVAIVGARACSGYGSTIARTLARELAARGYTIVSGLARGIDGEAHRGALEAQGKTWAVMGCGVERNYPAAHAQLAEQIVKRDGLIISEYGTDTEPAPWRFPARNRIIAALADAMIVVETRERSGALIAADFALELGRPLFAVPGEVTSSLSAGPNDLIARGHAKVCRSAADVLDELVPERLHAA